MSLIMDLNKVYTLEQVAKTLQLSKKTAYDLISKGEIGAKKYGKVYRIPASSISFAFTGINFPRPYDRGSMFGFVRKYPLGRYSSLSSLLSR